MLNNKIMSRVEKQLRATLKANALFSLLSGLCLLSFSDKLGRIMGIDQKDVLQYIGIALLAFTTLLLYNAFKTRINSTQIISIIVQDWAWVFASIILLALNPFKISLPGNILIAGVACIVTTLAIFQQYYLKNLDL
jgi:hypothetical protein